MSTILEQIESQIAEVKSDVAKSNVGYVREVMDGVVKIEGLTNVAMNEMIEFSSERQAGSEKSVQRRGLVLNLEETEVGAIVLGEYYGIREGDEVHATGQLLQVPVGKELLGRVVDSLGQPLCPGVGFLLIETWLF